ncbi:NAD(P)H-hydrate dehydratase [Mucilaginibacter myungsuensis]|uniref:Bifunctional NAD(P)H-hydrate repair enzyme n=1 Tax=Mucilaginibacter myungsuensis TaxID=649104 RepID=A0A929PZ22_9SPHI|nr:NAD(P)H-hydrate dehydratase [Mucilaginibacter myungsuensis]MBE9664055.1 NAD(P)H-hydrate dehydratase [Mucilaginibacter myungsuensis]MDN3601233.1 NAD(P)H-hydrate dehydratase [Mucilaginibacter myungsuensis]
MLPLLTAEQIRRADTHTIQHEPISSINLMERASKAFVAWFINHFPERSASISIYCGTGNNGGDGLAVARLLGHHRYLNIKIVIARFGKNSTADFDINFERLIATGIPYTEIQANDDLPEEKSDILIDALLGSGLNKPLAGDYLRLVTYLNDLQKTVVAVDVPTGLYTEGDQPKDSVVLKADLAITFQQPKLSFLLPGSGGHVDHWQCVNIGLDERFIRSLDSPYQYIEEKDIRQMLKPRTRFSNKGTFGHALIIAGQPETMGAALLSASACAHAGAGLTTACIPESGLTALNTYQPEVMAIVRGVKVADINWEKFSSVAIGPGLGKEQDAKDLLDDLIANFKKPVVVDADALNLLADDPELLKKLPANSILTPHMKEFDRLFGEHQSWWARVRTAIVKATELKICIVLKNSYTVIVTPEGKAYFNSTSNAAMASGGMGDVLTGILSALLVQKYSPVEACIIGCFIHGKAGDELALPNRMSVVLPGKLIQQLPLTMGKLMG